MGYTRTPINTDLPVTVLTAKEHARITFNDDDLAFEMMIRAAALDVEEAGALALLPTTITYITLPCPGIDLRLPIGPVPSDGGMTVETLADDGTATTLTGWWLEPGRFGIVHLSEATDYRVRVSYIAQVAETADDLPDDLRHAIADQAARYYDQRGGIEDKGPALSAHTASVIARYRGVRA